MRTHPTGQNRSANDPKVSVSFTHRNIAFPVKAWRVVSHQVLMRQVDVVLRKLRRKCGVDFDVSQFRRSRRRW